MPCFLLPYESVALFIIVLSHGLPSSFDILLLFLSAQEVRRPLLIRPRRRMAKKGTPKKNTSSGRATSTRKRGRRKVEEYDEEEAEEEEEEEEFVPSPRAKRARRGRRTDFNLDGGPHRRPRGKTPEGKLWDSHHGAWVDE